MSSLPLFVVVKHTLRRLDASLYLCHGVVQKKLDLSFSVTRSVLNELIGLFKAKLDWDNFIWEVVCWTDYVTEVDMRVGYLSPHYSVHIVVVSPKYR